MEPPVFSHSPHPEGYEKLWKLIGGIRCAMLTTVAEDGALHARPMMTLEADPGEAVLWFFTADDSPKVNEIYNERRVGVSYAEPARQDFVSVAGRAYVVRDAGKAAELWTDAAKAWFPGGPSDPRLVLLRVEVDSAQFWDAPSCAMTRLVAGPPPARECDSVKLDVR